MGRKGKKHKHNKLNRLHVNCVYCGKLSNCTEDHVVPQCFFPKGRRPARSEYAIVPACFDCNCKKSRYDQYVRDSIVSDLLCDSSKSACDLRNSVLRSTIDNRSEFGRGAKSQARLMSLHSTSGIYMGRYPAVPLKWERIDRFFRWVVRGLFWLVADKCCLVSDRCLPQDCLFQVRRLYPHALNSQFDVVKKYAGVGPVAIGDGVCEFRFFNLHDRPFVSHWIFGFYESVYFSVITWPREDMGLLETEGIDLVSMGLN